MRKMRSSGNTECKVSLSARAEARLRPNGFSTTIRPRSWRPTSAREVATVGNASGGIAM